MTDDTFLAPSWTVALGPGPQADLLEPLLHTLLERAAPGQAPRVEVWNDLDEVLGGLSQRGRLILDADRLPREDLGLVRRFLQRRSGWEILALGEEAPTGPAAQLLSHHRVQFCAWPLPVDRLITLLEAPTEPTLRPAPSQFRDRPHRRSAEERELDPRQVEAASSSDQQPPTGEGPSAGAAPGGDWLDGWDENWSEEKEDWPAEGGHPRADLQEIETILSTGAGDTGSSRHPADLIPRGGTPVATAAEATLPPRQESLLTEAMAIGLSREELDAFHSLDELPEELTDDLSELEVDADFDGDFDEAFEGEELAKAEDLEDAAARSLADALANEEWPQTDGEPAIPSDLSPSLDADLEPDPSPPRWYRSQIADLADLAQRLQLDSLAMREAGGAASGASDAWLALEQDVHRLGQFARTLGYVAAPPAPGSQSVELAGFVQELLSSLLGNGLGEGPRVLFRGDNQLLVRADKSQLGAALDAMAQLGVHCIHAATDDDALRVQVEQQNGAAVLQMDFAAGPLGGPLGPRPDLLEPYALRKTFPDFGANALAASGGIFAGHGGSLEALGQQGDRIALVARLPLA